MKKTLLSLPAAMLCAAFALASCSDGKDDDKKSPGDWCGYCGNLEKSCGSNAWTCIDMSSDKFKETFNESYCKNVLVGKIFVSEEKCREFKK